MSKLTPCNLCAFKELIGKYGDVVEVKDEPTPNFPKAKGIYYQGVLKAWFAHVPDDCVCEGVD